MPFTYMLRCSDGSLYVGSTLDLERRLWQHNSDTAGAAYTRRRRPVELVWCEEYDSIADAFTMEKRIQNWGRAKRLALIDGRRDDLHLYAGRGYASVEARQRVQGSRDGRGRPPRPT